MRAGPHQCRVFAAAMTLLAILCVITATRGVAQLDVAEVVDTAAGFYTRYYTTTCLGYSTPLTFQTGGPIDPASTTYVRSFDAVADTTLGGGIRIRAAFQNVDGVRFDAEQGFDPCQSSTCLGVYCENPNHVTTQEYSMPVRSYLMNTVALQFPRIGNSALRGVPRCTCRDPANNYAIAASSPVTVDPSSPSAERSVAQCSAYGCMEADGTTSDTNYYLYTPNTAANCQCCRKQGVLNPVQSAANCNTITPTLKWYALDAVPNNYRRFQCSANGTTWVQYNRCTSSNEAMCYGDYVRTATEPYVYTGPIEGYNVCDNAVCTGWYCDSGYGLVQNYQREGGTTTQISFAYNEIIAPSREGEAFNAPCFCGQLLVSGFVNPAYLPENMPQNNRLHVSVGGLHYRYDDAECAAQGYSCASAASQNLVKDADGTCYCCNHRDQPYYYNLVDPTDAAMCRAARHPSSSAASSWGSSASQSSGNSPNPVEVEGEKFYMFLTVICPAGTLAGVPITTVDENRDSICCQHYTEVAPAAASEHCGYELLSVRSEGKLSCNFTIDSNALTCCADVTQHGAVVHNGRSCPQPDGREDRSAARASAVTAALAAAVALILSVL